MDDRGFDVWADEYDASVRESDERGTYPFAGYAKVLGAVYEMARVNGAKTILDIGIGTGALAGRFYEDGCAVTGLDFSQRMIEKARAKMPGATLLRHDFAQGLPEAILGERFDAIVSTYALHHLPDADKAGLLRTLYGLLSPGGVLLVGDIGFQTPQAREALRAMAGDFDPDEHYAAYSEFGPMLTVPSAYTQYSPCAGVLRLKKPRMVIFDFGETLAFEPAPDILAAIRALMPYITDNPRGLTAEDIYAVESELYQSLSVLRNSHHAEVHEHMFLRFLHEYLQLTFSISVETIERIFMRASAPLYPAEGIEALLACLTAQGIRTGVISNIMYSGGALEAALADLLPGHRFEFIIASSEYIHRKPSPLLFELALRKADLPAGEVWHCGDNPLCDIEGAASVGITPLWYTQTPDPAACAVPYTHIAAWPELTAWMGCSTMKP